MSKTPGTATHIVNTVFTHLEHTDNYRVNSNKIAFLFLNAGHDAYISNGKTSFTVRFEVINLSCNPNITQENRLYWKFLQTCGQTHLDPALESMMTVGRFVVSVLRSSLPAVLSMSVIQSIKPTSRHVEKRNVHP